MVYQYQKKIVPYFVVSSKRLFKARLSKDMGVPAPTGKNIISTPNSALPDQTLVCNNMLFS